MKDYLGVKMIKAQPMTRGEWAVKKSEVNPEDRVDETPGYLVQYPDGYQSWSPAEAFESAYLELNDSTKITAGDLIRFLGIDPYAVDQLDEKTTLLRMVTRTGFVDYETSSCVDPINYNEEIGASICVDRLNTRLWDRLGFVLQWAKHGLDRVTEMPALQPATAETEQ